MPRPARKAVAAPLQASDVDLLHESLREAEKRAALLTELIEALSQSRDALTLVQRSVESVVRAIAAGGAFVYLWDEEAGHFVLRAATEGHQKAFIGRITLRAGEGVTGWSALMRRPVMIGQGLDQDPRVVTFPELMENDFHSCLTVPILVPGGDPVGVFSIYAAEEDAFTDNDMRLVEEVAKLLASGIDRAHVVDLWERQSSALDALIGIADTPPVDVRSCIAEIAQRMMAIVPSEICIVEAMDADDGTTEGVALAQRRDTGEVTPGPGTYGQLSATAARQLARTASPEQHTVSMSMRLGTRTVGVLTAYRIAPYTAEDRALLAAIGGYGALALQSFAVKGQGESALAQLLTARSDDEAATVLERFGWTSGVWVVPLVLRCDPELTLTGARSLDSVSHTVESVFTGRHRRPLPAATGVVGGFVMTATAARSEAETVARQVLQEVTAALQDRGQVVGVAIGVGTPAQTASAIAAQFRAAADASAWVASTQTGVRIGLAGDDQLPRRILAVGRTISDTVDTYVSALRRVQDHDERHNTELLSTLEVFVRERGSVQQASERLFIHRNTLRQRLNKIAALVERPVEELDDWLAISLAVLVLRTPA